MNDYGRDRLWLLGTAVLVMAVAFSPRLVPAPWDELVHMFVVPAIGSVVICFGLTRSRRLVAPKPVHSDQAQ